MTAEDPQSAHRGRNEPAAATLGISPGANGRAAHRVTTSRLQNKNISVEGLRTSMRLEPEFWDAIGELCRREDIDVAEMVRAAVLAHATGGRTSAVRVFVLDYFRRAAHRRT
jgi:predicted DNA-binding ribbon-helix-helix protein